MTEKLKVCLVNHWPPRSGVGRYAFSLFKHLQNRPYLDAFMFCTSRFDINQVDTRTRKKLMFPVDWTFNGNPLASRMVSYFLGPLFVPKKFDVYHIMDHMIGRYALYLHPSVVTVHDVSECRIYSKEDMLIPGATPFIHALNQIFAIPRLYNLLLWKSIWNSADADRIICVSDFARRDCISNLKVKERKIHVIPEGVDREVFRPLDKRKCRTLLGLPARDIPIILHVGSEIQRKNIDILFKAFKLVKRKLSNALLIRVGRQLSSTLTIMKDLGLEDSVLYFRNIADEELVYVYNSADIFVFPSSYEGFGLPVVEALACGAPVIGGKCDAIVDALGDAGILVPPRNEQALAQTMIELLDDYRWRQELSRKALKRADLFDWKKVVSKCEAIYFQLANAERTSSQINF